MEPTLLAFALAKRSDIDRKERKHHITEAISLVASRVIIGQEIPLLGERNELLAF